MGEIIGFQAEIQATDTKYVGFSANIQPKKFVEHPDLENRNNEAVKRLGSPIHIIRGDLIVESYAIISPLQRISSPKTLQLIRAAWFMTQVDVQGGDYILDLNQNVQYLYLAQNELEQEGEVVGIRSIIEKCNHVITVFRYVETPTGYGGVVQKFEMVKKGIPVGIEFIRPGLREAEPGYFKDSTHRMYVPASVGLEILDRIQIMSDLFQIDDIDTVTFPGTHQCTLCRDRRQSD